MLPPSRRIEIHRYAARDDLRESILMGVVAGDPCDEP
jgi:hypothetical protein